MSHTIEVSDEDLIQLQGLLAQGIKRTHEELRRTENFSYREILRHNLDVMDKLLRLVETAERTVQVA